jgi:hypothetical protein
MILVTTNHPCLRVGCHRAGEGEQPCKSSCPSCSSIASNHEIKAPSNKRTTTGCSCSSTGGSVIKPLRHLVHREGGLGLSLEAIILLLQVIVPTMMLRLYSLSLEVDAVQQQLHLLCEFIPTGEFVLRQLLNHGGMNKLSQLSVAVSFTLWVTCLDPFPYMLPKVSIQSIGHASLVLRLA